MEQRTAELQKQLQLQLQKLEVAKEKAKVQAAELAQVRASEAKGMSSVATAQLLNMSGVSTVASGPYVALVTNSSSSTADTASQNRLGSATGAKPVAVAAAAVAVGAGQQQQQGK